MSSPDVDDDEEEQQPISEDFLCSLLLEREDVKAGRTPPGRRSDLPLPRPASPPPPRHRHRGGEEGPGTAKRAAADAVAPHDCPPPPNYSIQKQRRHPSDRRSARRKPDWPTCLLHAVANSNRRAFDDDDDDDGGGGDDDHPNDGDEATHPDDESPTTAPRRRRDGGGADRGAGPASSSRPRLREFPSPTAKQNARTIALAVLAASALACAEYGAARSSYSSSSSAVADLATVSLAPPTSSGRDYDDAHRHSRRNRPAVGGHQARGRGPIPAEYSNLADLAEFADAVAALRAHHDGRSPERAVDDPQRRRQREERERPHPHGIDGEHRDDADLGNAEEADDNEEGDDKVGGEEVEDELKEMSDAINISWKGAIERTNPVMDQQLQPPHDLPKVHVPFYWHGERY